MPAAEVDAWACEHSLACVYLLVSSGEVESVHAAEARGFQVMDVRVELVRPAGPETAPLRGARSDDLEALRRIARGNHGVTRFYADPRFPNERCDELYDVWIARSVEGWAEAVLVAEVEGRPAGYVSCHADDGRGRGSIGLIGVGESARGQGLGRALVLAAVDWCHGRGLVEIAIVTQGRNVPAQRLFGRCGFLVESVDLWLHKWYDA